MSFSPALADLLSRVTTNTLTAAQQAALSVALGELVDDFPSPDEIANSIIDSRQARIWIAALYTIQAEGVSPVPTVTTGTTIVPTPAALSLVPDASLPNGAPAEVLPPVGAAFSLDKTSTLAIDGITVLATESGTGRWIRGATLVGPSAEAQTTWFVDNGKTLTTSSDANDGLTAATALVTKAEIARRWGSWAPTIRGGITVNVNFIGTDPSDGTDPWLAEPLMQGGSKMILRDGAPAPPAFTGTLLAVTPKNRAANQALMSTFTTTTGALGTLMFLVNTTRGNSVAYAFRDTGAGVWLLSQPCAPQAPGATAVTEVDTWANGDAIEGFVFRAVDVARMGGTDSSGGGFHVAYRIGIFGSSDVEFATTIKTCCNESFVGANVVVDEVGVSQPQMVNAVVQAIASVEATTSLTFTAGIFSAFLAFGKGFLFQNDVIMACTCFSSQTTFGNAYSDSATFALTGSNLQQPGTSTYGIIGYGVNGGTLTYTAPATTALVAATHVGSSMNISQSVNAYSNVTVAGVVTVHGGIPITPANLDAAAGAAGFGGLAYIPGVGGFAAAGVAP